MGRTLEPIPDAAEEHSTSPPFHNHPAAVTWGKELAACQPPETMGALDFVTDIADEKLVQPSIPSLLDVSTPQYKINSHQDQESAKLKAFASTPTLAQLVAAEEEDCDNDLDDAFHAMSAPAALCKGKRGTAARRQLQIAADANKVILLSVCQ